MDPDQRHLVSETQQRIVQVEGAIDQIQCVKKHLKQNSQQVKSQIHTTISRQLESLRNREVWLLGQVDVVEHAKEEVLRTQQDHLCCVLGGLQKSLEFSETEDTQEVDGRHRKKLSDSMERLDMLELKPKETSNISFSADIPCLREAIHSFGRVDSKGLGMGHAFVDPETPSTSLPRAFEDYGDAEHHVLYKTLAEIKREKNKDTSIHVTIPKLSKMAGKEWLYGSSASAAPTKTVSSSSSNKCQAPSTLDLTPWMSKYDQGCARSIQQWLNDIKQEVEVEEDDFELVSPTYTNTVSEDSDSIVMLQDSEIKTSVIPSFGYFTEVQASPAKDWLTSVQDTEAADQSVVIMKEMDTKLTDLKKWLAGYTQVPSKEEAPEEKDTCCKNKCGSPKEQSFEIENLDQLLCVQENGDKVWNSPADKNWLAQRKASDSSDMQEKDIDEKELEVEHACRANELCQSFSECVFDENCCSAVKTSPEPKPFPALSPAVQEWLLQPKSPAMMEDIHSSALFSYFNTGFQNYSQWLLPPSSYVTEPEVVPYDLFPVFKKGATQMSDWLLEGVGNAPMETPEMICPVLAHLKEIQGSSSKDWVREQHARPLTLNLTCPGDVSFRHHGADAKDWLKPAAGYTRVLVEEPSYKTHPASINLQMGADTNERNWLLQSESKPEATASPKQPIKLDFSSVPLKNQKWLLEKEDQHHANVGTVKSSKFVMEKMNFIDMLANKSWLFNESTLAKTSKEDTSAINQTGLKDIGREETEDGEEDDEESLWLLKKESVSTEKLNSPEALFSNFQKGDGSEIWLLKNESSKKMEKNDEVLFPCFNTKNENIGQWLLYGQ